VEFVRRAQRVDERRALVQFRVWRTDVVAGETNAVTDGIADVADVGRCHVVPLGGEFASDGVVPANTHLDEARTRRVLVGYVPGDGFHAGFIIRGG